MTNSTTSYLSLQGEAYRKAERLFQKYPDQAIYVIWDYDEQQYDAATQDDLDYLSEINQQFTVIYAAF